MAINPKRVLNAGSSPHPPFSDEVQTRLAWPLHLTGAGLVLERLWQALWPLVSLALICFALWRFGLLGPGAPSAWIWAVAGLTGLALIYGARQFRWPDHATRLSRLESTLPGRPITALADEQATGRDDPAARAVWEAHQKRMHAQIKGLRAAPPNLRIATKDPLGLRLIATTAAMVALLFAPWPGQTNTQGNAPAQHTASASWEGWIEPPSYTGRASLYLNDQPQGVLRVPAGSRLTLRLYGEIDTLGVTADLSDTPLEDAPQPSVTQIITRDGPLQISGAADTAWQIRVIADQPPSIRTTAPLTRHLAGDFALPFAARDDYAVTALNAEINLNLPKVDRRHGLQANPDPQAPLILDLPLPYRGTRDQVDGLLEDNLAQHPLAGLPVTLTLTAKDGTDQTGHAAPQQIILPARHFLHPLAKALIEQRRDLLWSHQNAPRIAQILRSILHRPEDLAMPDGVYLRLRGGIRRLETSVGQTLPTPIRDEVAQLLWQVATELDDGRLDDAKARMQQAQDRLEQALRDGASEDEIAELMQEFRDAMRDYMRELAQNGSDAPSPNQPPPDGAVQMSQADLDAMLDRIEELMREGRTADAMQMLDQLRQMMENMQMAENNGTNQQGDAAREALQDTLRQQQGLSDRAFRDLQEQGQGNQAGEADGNEGRDGGQGRGQSHSGSDGQQGQNGQGSGPDNNGTKQGDLAQQQRRLKSELDAQRRNLPGASDEAGQAARDALNEAGRAMGQAADAMENGDLAEALGQQADAIEALREGLRQFDQAMDNQQAQRDGEQGNSPGAGRQADKADPMGRGPNNGSASATDDPLYEGEDVYRRAQELMDELRRRSGDGTRPDVERDYLERLLDQF